MENLGKPAPERLNQSGFFYFNAARDDGMAVASAGLYANHLHLTRYVSTPLPHCSVFCRSDALPDAQPSKN